MPPQSIDGLDAAVEIMFISDDAELADMYRLKLELDGYAVTLVTTEEARAASLQPAPDIVYLDVGLLRQAGLATHRRLRAQLGTRHVPIVLVSTRVAREDLPAALKLSVHDFLIASDSVLPDSFWKEIQR